MKLLLKNLKVLLLLFLTIALNLSKSFSSATDLDTIPPVALAKNITVSLVDGEAYITAADVDNGSYDNVGIVYMKVMPEGFGCKEEGSREVTFTVKDAAGNTSSTTAIVTILNSYPDISLTSASPLPGLLPNTIYKGYSSTGIQLNTDVVGGTNGYSFSWSPEEGLSNPNIANPIANPEVSTSYTVTVTSAGGCESSANIDICVLDIRSVDKKGKQDGKVLICHNTPGNNSNPKVLSVSANAVAAHLAHGDAIGPCGTGIGSCSGVNAFSFRKGNNSTEFSIVDELTIQCYPNPFTTELNVYIESNSESNAFVRLMDMHGRIVYVNENYEPFTYLNIADELLPGMYFLEVSQDHNKKIIKVSKTK